MLIDVYIVWGMNYVLFGYFLFLFFLHV